MPIPTSCRGTAFVFLPESGARVAMSNFPGPVRSFAHAHGLGTCGTAGALWKEMSKLV